MWITFSKVWGQDEHRWNYCGGSWNFNSMSNFMQAYGIKEAFPIVKESYFDESGKEIECIEYSGYATKNLDLLKKHWHVEYCKPCVVTKIIL